MARSWCISPMGRRGCWSRISILPRLPGCSRHAANLSDGVGGVDLGTASGRRRIASAALGPMRQTMRDDLRTALRSLRSAPGFTCAALIVLTLGIGATTAIFSVVDAVVLRGLPFDEHDRLVAVGERLRPSGQAGRTDRDPEALNLVSPPNYLDWATQQHVFESIGASASGWFTLHEPGAEPESLVPQRVTADLFNVLRVRPVIGRAFTAENEIAGRDRVAVLSDGLWRRRFGAASQVVWQAMPLEDLEGGHGPAESGGYEVIG